MSPQQYRPIDAPSNESWEFEEYGSSYRPPGLHGDNAAANLMAEHEADDLSNYHHNYQTTASDSLQPTTYHTSISATSLTSQHNFNTDHYQEEGILGSHPKGRRMRRYIFRTVVGVFGPIIVLCYLIFIWQLYLVPIDPDSSVAFGPPGAKWIFYSCFVAGIIGLNLSLYGLAGAEAGMLMEPFWRVNDAMGLMLHADNTWSGPGGWMKAMKWSVQMRQGGKPSRRPGRLWFILALPSVVVFTAWPLSGLCLEMTSGFMRGSHRVATTVTGFVYSDFNVSPGSLVHPSLNNVSSGARSPSKEPSFEARVPGFGAVYTPKGFDRSKVKFLKEVPVVLPNDEGVEQIFLTAQGEAPIEGKAWGLQVHYECSIVNKLSDMQLLKNRKSPEEVWGMGGRSAMPDIGRTDREVIWEEPLQMPPSPEPTESEPDYPLGETVPVESSETVFDFSTAESVRVKPTQTLAGFPLEETVARRAFPMEIPTETPAETPTRTTTQTPLQTPTQSLATFYYDDEHLVKYEHYRINDNTTLVEVRKEPQGMWNGLHDWKSDKWSLNMDAVLETAYETLLMPDDYVVESPCSYSDRLQDNSPTGYCYYHMDHYLTQNNSKMDQRRVFEILVWQGLGAAYTDVNASLFNSTIDNAIADLEGEYVSVAGDMKAIGVTCTSSSSVGTADIDAAHFSYSNFVRSDTPIPNRRGDCARQFGAETLACTLNMQKKDWLKWLFDSVAAPLPIDGYAFSNNFLIGTEFSSNTQLVYLQAAQLRQSMLQTFSSYAIKLMYNNGRDFVGPDGGRLTKDNGNVTAFVPGTVIKGNVVPGSIPIALFGLWAFISSGLCLIYGFRRRWTAILDGHTVFRLGVELENTYKTKLQIHSTLAEVEECTALHEIPGFIGDTDHSNAEGKIGLVDGKGPQNFASKTKHYR